MVYIKSLSSFWIPTFQQWIHLISNYYPTTASTDVFLSQSANYSSKRKKEMLTTIVWFSRSAITWSSLTKELRKSMPKSIMELDLVHTKRLHHPFSKWNWFIFCICYLSTLTNDTLGRCASYNCNQNIINIAYPKHSFTLILVLMYI